MMVNCYNTIYHILLVYNSTIDVVKYWKHQTYMNAMQNTIPFFKSKMDNMQLKVKKGYD